MKITINTESAAFDIEEERAKFELSRILNKLAADIESGKEPATLKDLNGNTVGNVSY